MVSELIISCLKSFYSWLIPLFLYYCGGTGKLRSFWEDKVHVVVSKKGDMPVYVVEPEDGEGRQRVLHRNLLLPCGYLPVSKEGAKPQQTPRRNRNARKRRNQTNTRQSSAPDEDSGSDDDQGLYPNQLEEVCELPRTSRDVGTIDIVESDRNDTSHSGQVDQDSQELHQLWRMTYQQLEVTAHKATSDKDDVRPSWRTVNATLHNSWYSESIDTSWILVSFWAWSTTPLLPSFLPSNQFTVPIRRLLSTAV